MLILITLLLILFIYALSQRKYNYWKNKNVPYLKPVPFLGNYADFILLKTSIANVLSKICDRFPKEPCIGSFYGTEPALIVQDPEMIKLILTKDFYYFNGREVSEHVEREPSTKDLFFAHGNKWKVIRQNLTPLYTASKIRTFFSLIESCLRRFESVLEDEVKNSEVIKINSLISRFTLDCISSTAFGIETGVMQNDSKVNNFKIMSDGIFENSTYRGFKNNFRSLWPAIFYRLGFHTYRRDTVKFFADLLSEVFEERNYKPSARNDFVDLILQFTNNEYLVGNSIKKPDTGESEHVSIKVDNELLAAQCVSFLGAGYETSAHAIVMTLFQIANNEDAQDKALQEIDKYLEDNNCVINHDCVTKLPYLEACVDEAIRFYPSIPNLTREVMEDYTFPSGLRVDKGVRIHIPLMHIHRNAEHFPEPHKYRPERFLPGEKQNITPYTYLPFGEGFRICIGQRFAKMLIITGLVTVLKCYKVQLAEGQSTVLDFDPRVVVNRPTCEIKLKLVKRENGRCYQQRPFSIIIL